METMDKTMDKQEKTSPETTKHKRLEMQYFKVCIIVGIITAILSALNFAFDHFLAKPEQFSDSGHIDSGGIYVEGEGSTSSNTVNEEGSTSSNATASGEGSTSSSTVMNGDGGTMVNGDIYNGVAAGLQAYKPGDFEDFDKALAHSASLIESKEEEKALDFLIEFLQIEDLDEQTKAAVKYNYGICCLRMEGRHPEAVEYLLDAASMSRSPYAYYNLGCAYLNSEEYKEAVEALTTALELSAKSGWDVPPEDMECFSAALAEAKALNAAESVPKSV